MTRRPSKLSKTEELRRIVSACARANNTGLTHQEVLQNFQDYPNYYFTPEYRASSPRFKKLLYRACDEALNQPCFAFYPKATKLRPNPATAAALVTWSAIAGGIGYICTDSKCALSYSFWGCETCPIAKAAGKYQCRNTPYQAFIKASHHEIWRRVNQRVLLYHLRCIPGVAIGTALKPANEMLKFVRRLRP